MSEQISQRELRNDSGRIMRGLDDGRTFVIARNGRPIGELRPMRRDRLVDTGVALHAFRQAPGVDLGLLRADLDAVVDPEATPRG